MFSQKKSFWKGKIFVLLVAGLLAGGYWIEKGGAGAPGEETGQNPELSTHDQAAAPSREADNPQPVRQQSQRPSVTERIPEEGAEGMTGGVTKSITEGAEEDVSEGAAKSVTKGAGEGVSEETAKAPTEGIAKGTTEGENEGQTPPYYLVRNDGGIIKIYYCEEGKPDQFIRAVDINVSLLSESDQKMFRKGVILKTKDDLSELLQDFDS